MIPTSIILRYSRSRSSGYIVTSPIPIQDINKAPYEFTYQPSLTYTMKITNTKLILALTIASLANPAAFAASESNATIEKLNYQLLDLDPTDSITPSITFSGITNSSSSNSASWTGSDYSSSSSSTQKPNFSANNAASLLDNASSSAGFSGSTLMSSGKVDGHGTYNASASLNSTFTLSPHTLLMMTGAISTSSQAEQGNSYSYDKSAQSFASISLSGKLISGSDDYYCCDNHYGTQNSSISLSSSHQYWTTEPDQSTSFSLSFINNNGSDLTGLFSASVSASGSDSAAANLSTMMAPLSVAAVPEPETYLMMFTGLTLMGVAARHRKLIK